MIIMRYYILNMTVALIFIVFYTLTMTLDNDILYLGTEDIWSGVLLNNKLPFQVFAYYYLLPILCLLVYFYQRTKYKIHSRLKFILASFISVIIIYILCYAICRIQDSNAWNLYYYPRGGAPVRISIFINSLILTVGILLFEQVRKGIYRNNRKIL